MITCAHVLPHRRVRRLAALTACLAALTACGTPSRPPASAGAEAGARLPEVQKELSLVRLDASAGSRGEPLLEAMRRELSRAQSELGKQPIPPYYIAYGAYETRSVTRSASDGFLIDRTDDTERVLDIDLRVGSPALDNTHGGTGSPFLGLVSLPVENDELALRTPIWLATERSFRSATEELIQVSANKTVQAEEEDQSPDFTHGQAVEHLEPRVALAFDAVSWESRIRELSKAFLKHPNIETSYVQLNATATTRLFVNTENTTVQTSNVKAFVSFGGRITAPDGTLLSHDRQIYAHSLAELPDQNTLSKEVDGLIAELMALHSAERGDPYIGPALLDGRAAAVLFHEVLGHRAEGHRQRMQWEGKTFKKKVAELVMPKGFDVLDNPLVSQLNGVDLNGAYLFDDEGVRAEPVQIIEDGRFREFLMSRTPIEGFSASNGHGRKQPGFRSVSRQGNLIVDPHRVTHVAALKRALLDEVDRQGLPFGIRVSEVTGGDTQTSAYDPQAFQVRPVLVFKVYPDGREELIRDVKLEGTPLSLLSHVVAASNDYAVFNGFCGAESGQVPVSATSPSLLVSKIEMAKTPKGTERPPLLPPPTLGPASR